MCVFIKIIIDIFLFASMIIPDLKLILCLFFLHDYMEANILKYEHIYMIMFQKARLFSGYLVASIES